MPDRFRSWWSLAAPALAALVLAAFAAPYASAQPDPSTETCRNRSAQTQVRPLDPLTQAECARAIRAVFADARTRELVTGRQFDVAYAELLPGKGRGETPVRQAEVVVSVYDGQPTGVRAVVDLARGTVVDVGRVASTRAQALAAPGRPDITPISPAEVALARGLAMRDAAFRTRVGAAPEEVTVEVLPVTEVDETCPSGRCVELLFRRGREYSTTTAVVDISSRAVRYRGGGRPQ
jgi:hypothetical protein